MKKTLFIAALAASLMGSVHAELMDGVIITTEGATWIGTDVTIDANNLGNYLSAPGSETSETFSSSLGNIISVGCRAGAGSLTIDGKYGAYRMYTPNCLFVGGGGWPNGDTVLGADGKVEVTNGAQLAVGRIYETGAAGKQFTVGNSHSQVTGELNINNGGVVFANYITVVGGGNGTGVVKVDGLGSMLLIYPDGSAAGAEAQVHVAMDATSKGSIIVSNGAAVTVPYGDGVPDVPTHIFIGENGTGIVTVDGGYFDVRKPGVEVRLGVNEGSSGTVEVVNGGKWVSNNLALGSNGGEGGMYVEQGSTAEFVGGTRLVNGLIENEGTITARVLEIQGESVFVNERGAETTVLGLTDSETNETTYLDISGNGTFINKNGASLTSYGLVVTDKGTFINEGQLDMYGDILLKDSAVFRSGIVSIYGYESEVNTGTGGGTGAGTGGGEGTGTGGGTTPAKGFSYDTGITFRDANGNVIGNSIKVEEGSHVTVGAKIVGKEGEVDQHIDSTNLAEINAVVLEKLNLENVESVTVANRIGERVTSVFTTDEVYPGSDNVVCLEGGTAIIDRGANAATCDGTLGSYSGDLDESAACIRFDENSTASKLEWGGGRLSTVGGETTKITEGNTVALKQGSGPLVVEKDSTLANNGAIASDVVEVKDGGTLKGTGEIKGSTESSKVTVQVDKGGTFVIGNSPGYEAVSGDVNLDGDMVFCIAGFEAATTGTSGWASGTHSQVDLKGGEFVVGPTGSITIVFGGDSLFNSSNYYQDLEFEIVLVKNAVVSIDFDLGRIDALLGTTYFKMAGERAGLEEDGIPGMEKAWFVLDKKDCKYTLEDSAEVEGTSNIVFHGKVKIVPEPATATLSLLALAALAARRRRKH